MEQEIKKINENEITKEGNENNSEWEWKKVDETPIFKFEKEGDTVQGELIDIQKEVGIHNSKIYTLLESFGIGVSFWGSTVLDSKLKTIKIGERIKVVYKGKVQPPKGQEYKVFDVFRAK